MSSKIKLLFFSYFITIVFLFLYTFTQVDLNLTLSQASWWQAFQKFFQSIGYYNRPLSTFLYISIISLMFLFYAVSLRLSALNKIRRKHIWILVLGITGILTFSYNAFSYDLFNYIFDAKIVTFYNESPYIHKALDYMGDPMLTFMRWTHRTYPYGPFWLGLTVPVSFVGFNFFLLTFFMFKILTSLFFLGIVFFIEKILKIVSPKYTILGMVFFALNPLVLIEGLVSSHNDISMMFFAMFAVYLLLINKYIFSFITLVLSIGIKFATVILAPVFLLFIMKKKNITKIQILHVLFFAMFIPLILVVIRTNFQPWYLLFILPFASLIPNKSYAIGVGIILSFFALLQYVPFIYNGDWNDPTPQILYMLTVTGFIIYVAYILLDRLLISSEK